MYDAFSDSAFVFFTRLGIHVPQLTHAYHVHRTFLQGSRKRALIFVLCMRVYIPVTAWMNECFTRRSSAFGMLERSQQGVHLYLAR